MTDDNRDDTPPGAPRTDTLFAEPRTGIDDFVFDEQTAAVFDDMLDRSEPFYAEQQRMIGEVVADFAVDGTLINDLGCSTANTFLSIASHLAREINREPLVASLRHGLQKDIEIAQKREALENVLIPYRLEENKRLLRRVGFEHIDVFFKWYNFCGIIATK